MSHTCNAMINMYCEVSFLHWTSFYDVIHKISKVFSYMVPNLPVTLLYLVSLLFASPILHSTNHFFNRDLLDPLSVYLLQDEM